MCWLMGKEAKSCGGNLTRNQNNGEIEFEALEQIQSGRPRFAHLEASKPQRRGKQGLKRRSRGQTRDSARNGPFGLIRLDNAS